MPHNSRFFGIFDAKEAVLLVERIIDDWRGMVRKYVNKDVTKVPAACVKRSFFKDTAVLMKNGSYAEYKFYTVTPAAPVISLFTLPTSPINNYYGMRYAVSVDDGALKMADFRTFGRSEEWKQKVLRNSAERKINMPLMDKGKHRLKIYCIDPGVVLTSIVIDLGGLQKAYSSIPETK